MATNFDPDEFMQRLAEAAARIEKEADPLIQAEKKMAEEADKNAKALGTFGKSLGSAAGQFGKAMTSASEGAGKYAGSFEAAGNAAKVFTSGMGPLAKTVGVVVDLFSKLAGGVLKQNEALVKSYRSLSQVGDVGKSFQNIMQDMQDAGFSVNESSEAYTNIINKSATGLAVFAGSARDGVEALHENYNVLKLSEKQMQRYGMSQEEMFDRTATFMGILAMSGNKEKRSSEELGAVTRTYLTNLAELSMLTGESRDAQEQKMQKDANDLRYQLMLSEQTDEMKLRMNATMMDLPDQLREGAKSIIVNQGRVVDEQGAAFFQALGHKGIAAMMTAINDKTTDVSVAVGRMQATHADILDKQFKNFRPVINTANDGMKDFALTAETNAYRIRGHAFDEEKHRERLAKLRSDGENKDMDENTARLLKERKLRNSFEQFEFQMSKFILPMLDSFMDSMTALGESMADFAYTFSFGKIDVRDAFAQINSYTDAVRIIEEQTKKQIKLNEEEEKIKKELQEFEQRKEKAKTAWFGSNPEDFDKDIENQREKLRNVQSEKARSARIIGKAQKQGTTMSQNQTADKRAEGAGETAPTTRGLGGNQIELATVASKSGKSTQVAKEYQHAFQALIDYLDQSGYKINSLGGFADRSNVNDPSKKSIHAYGGAIDINPDTNPNGSKLITDMPTNIGAIAAGLGLGWGGNWKSVKDAMHFSAASSEGGSLLQAKNGGIFSGPVQGYNVKLHGDEMVTPVNKGVIKQPLSSQSNLGSSESLATYFMAMVEKLENLVELQERNNRTGEEHLQYAKSN